MARDLITIDNLWPLLNENCIPKEEYFDIESAKYELIEIEHICLDDYFAIMYTNTIIKRYYNCYCYRSL